MKRVIVSPFALSGAPLDDLKSWLSITTNREDSLLEDMLRAAIEMFENFTGLMPLTQLCDERFRADTQSHVLASHPVSFFTELRGISIYGDRPVISAEDYEHEIDADGRVHIRLTKDQPYSRVEARMSVGIADGWAELDSGIRQGIIRLAAYYYRERDEGPKAVSPPASVAALWRPWREVRLT